MKEDKDRLFQFPFYPADFLVSTMLMSPAEVGAYMRLLCHSWIEDGIPYKSKSYLARLAGISPSKLDQILSKFYVDDENRVRHVRLETERKKVVELREKRVKAGRIGGNANKQRLTIALAKEKQVQSTAKPNKTKQNKTEQSPPISPRDFETKTLSTADRIGMEKARELIAEEIKTILNKAGRNAMQEVISWGSPDDPERLKDLRAREREIKSQLMGLTPRKRENPINQGMQELASELADEMRL
tara:strand:- start:230 stop:961 length:732 start_codon:yes stop_codon:yes gene_type:complete